MNTSAAKTGRSESSPSSDERPSQRARTDGGDANASAFITPRPARSGRGAATSITQTQTEHSVREGEIDLTDPEAPAVEPGSLEDLIDKLREFYTKKDIAETLKAIKAIFLAKEEEGILDTAVSMGILAALKYRMSEDSFSFLGPGEVQELNLFLLEKIASAACTSSESVNKAIVEMKVLDILLSWMGSNQSLSNATLQKTGLQIINSLVQVPTTTFHHPRVTCSRCKAHPVVGFKHTTKGSRYEESIEICQECLVNYYVGSYEFFRCQQGVPKEEPLPSYKQLAIQKLVGAGASGDECMFILKAMDTHQGSDEIQNVGCEIIDNILKCDPKNSLGLRSKVRKAAMPRLSKIIEVHEETSSLYKKAREVVKLLL